MSPWMDAVIVPAPGSAPMWERMETLGGGSDGILSIAAAYQLCY